MLHLCRLDPDDSPADFTQFFTIDVVCGPNPDAFSLDFTQFFTIDDICLNCMFNVLLI